MLKRYISGCGVGIYEDTNLTRCVSIINDTTGVLLVDVKIERYQRMVVQHDALGALQQLATLADVGLERRRAEQAVVFRAAVMRQVDAEVALEILGESVGVIVVPQPTTRAGHHHSSNTTNKRGADDCHCQRAGNRDCQRYGYRSGTGHGSCRSHCHSPTEHLQLGYTRKSRSQRLTEF